MPKPQGIASVRQLAKAVDRTHTAVNRWVKDDRWPFARKAPWSKNDVPKILRWAADHLAKEGGPRPTEHSSTTATLRQQKLEQEIRKLRAHADQAETALAKERGDLHDADACEEEAVRRAALYRNGVQNIPMQVVSVALSQGLPHEAAPAFQKQIEELVNGCLRYTAAAGDAQSEAGDDAGAAGAAAA